MIVSMKRLIVLAMTAMGAVMVYKLLNEEYQPPPVK